MVPRSYTKLNETVFDIYQERARLPWHYKAFATLSTWLALAGYVVFAIVFTSRPDNLQAQPTTLTTLAGVALLIGYAGVIITGVLNRSTLFIFDDLLLPTLYVSIMGIFITAMNQGLHKRFDIDTQAYIYVPLVTACVSTLFATVFSTIAYFKLRRVKDIDERTRMHIPIERYPSYNASSPGLVQPTPALMEFVPDDEAQRRQLLRLLIAREGPNVNMDDNSSTYKIDLPWDGAGGRQRSGSVPDIGNKSRWNLSSIVPGRGRSDTRENYKDPRERRREEIERSSILVTDPLVGGNSWPRSTSTPAAPAWAGQMARYG